MANSLKMATANAIVALWRRGWSYRRIARELGIHRETVCRYVKLALEEAKPAEVTAGNQTSRSRCEPFRKIIVEKVETGLSAQRIYQDLVCECGFAAGYESVKRFVRRLRKASPLPYRRMECAPGEEAQVDFGRGAAVLTPEGKKRWPHVFRIVLSHSRKGYSEAVWRQTTESFIRCLENAFRYFGGVPRTLVIDCLRAAVTKADWYDPQLNPKVEEFCRYYGTVILPTKPYMPRHKGKVERGIAYVRNNALKGHVFKSLTGEDQHLLRWETQVADHRIHGTTRKQVQKVFLEHERPALLPLPPMPFPLFHESERSVHRDAHVEVDKAYYSVPPEYMGRKVWVRWDGRLVRIFNQRMEQIAVHVKRDQGRFSTNPAHIASEKISAVERGAEALLVRAELIGTHAGNWAQAMIQRRGIQGVRVLVGLLSLVGRYRSHAIDRACQLALAHETFRLRDVRSLIERPCRQEQAQFLEKHPIIRDMADYADAVRVSFRQEARKDTNEFVALEAPSGEHKEKSPPRRALPAVQPPASALGSLSSGALSSGQAHSNIVDPHFTVKLSKGRSQ
jgi:transposase